MPGLPDLDRCARILKEVPLGTRTGLLTQVVGLLIECKGLHSAMGDLCVVDRNEGPLEMEVVGFRGSSSLLMPLGEADGLRPGARVTPKEARLSVRCGTPLLGRVLDGLGRPIDGKAALPVSMECRSLVRPAPPPLERVEIDDPLPTGVSVIDAFLTLGRGQRVGIFAGSGVGKSTLLADVARETLADVNVIAMVGERGREVRHFIEETLGPEGLRRSVVVVATSDAPPLIRIKAASTAVAIAEWFRDQGHDVMMMVDSVTRLAAATREVGLALGEPPTVKGYPPSFFSSMPKLIERMGRTTKGSITGILTVLVDGDDPNDPVADTLRGLLDGHIVLSREIAHRGLFPSVDVLRSVSRIMDRITTPAHRNAASKVRSLLAAYEQVRDLVAVGAYKSGSDPKVDRALRSMSEIEKLMTQAVRQGRPFDETIKRLVTLGESA